MLRELDAYFGGGEDIFDALSQLHFGTLVTITESSNEKCIQESQGSSQHDGSQGVYKYPSLSKRGLPSLLLKQIRCLITITININIEINASAKVLRLTLGLGHGFLLGCQLVGFWSKHFCFQLPAIKTLSNKIWISCNK